MSHSQLEQEFLNDHRHLTRGFRLLIEAVEKNDASRFRREADELDRAAGPHIEFEELVLYPRVHEHRDDDLRARLVREHQLAHAVLMFLMDQDGAPLKPADQARVLEQLRVALDHAVTCGTLLSQLTVLSDIEQEALLSRLQEFRSRGLRWTELGGHVSATAHE